MKFFQQRNLQNIKTIFEEKSGLSLSPAPCRPYRTLLTACLVLLCCVVGSGFAHSLFSSLQGDSLSLLPRYVGDGVFEIKIENNSHKELHFQEQIKLMQWSNSEEIAPLSDEVQFSGTEFAPHSEGIMTIDLSAAYDIGFLEQPLENDHYYLVLTNNDFVFGQDWICSVDFEVGDFPELPEQTEETAAPVPAPTSKLANSAWAWPTSSERISSYYGERFDHINIQGQLGDEVYAVAEGTVLLADFDNSKGYFLRLDLGDGVEVEYGHLASILVDAGESVSRGQLIATLGSSGMSTGPNLSFYLYENGTAHNPLVE